MAIQFISQRIQPTVSATPDYQDGDAQGGVMSFYKFDRSGLITRICLQTTVTMVGNTIIHFFDASPADSTFTDNGAVSIHANDKAKRFASLLLLVASEQLDAGAGLLEYNRYVTLPFQTSTNLHVALEAAGATNLGAATDLVVWLGGEAGS